VPYDQQQFAALMPERAGLLDVSDDEQATLAHRIAAEVGAPDGLRGRFD
jgi:hypothetical protein